MSEDEQPLESNGTTGLWESALSTLEGKITPRFFLFPLSMTALCLFLTVKVLESRKWR